MAVGLVDGGVFRGRSIIASDRNRKEAITIREPVYAPQASYGGNQAPSPWPPATHGTAGQAEYYTFGNYAGEGTSVSQSVRRGGGIQYSLPYRGYAETPSEAGQSVETWHGEDGGYVTTEPRKVVISGFPTHSKLADVKAWIRRSVGSLRISSIDVPLTGSGKYLRGHAFIIFETAEGAANAVDMFDAAGLRFQRASIAARLTVEGVTEGERLVESYQPKPSQSRQSEEASSSTETHGQARLSGESSSRRSKHSTQAKSKDKKGSGKKSDKKGSSKKRSTSSRKPDDDPGPPLIVDGSFYRREKA